MAPTGKAGARSSSLADNAGKSGEADKAGEAGKIGTLFREAWLEREGMGSDGGERSARDRGQKIVRASEEDLSVLQFLGFHPCHWV